MFTFNIVIIDEEYVYNLFLQEQSDRCHIFNMSFERECEFVLQAQMSDLFNLN